MLMIANIALDRCSAHAGHVDVPAVDKIAFGHRAQDPGVNGVTVHNFQLRKANALFKTRGRSHARDHHQLDELLSLEGQLPALGLLEPIFGRRDVFRSKRFEKLVRIKGELACRQPASCGASLYNIPPAACPAKTPFLSPCRGMGTRGHGAQRCTGEWAGSSRAERLRQDRTGRARQTGAGPLGS